MIRTHTRRLTDEERRSIPRKLPWFLFDRRRKVRRDVERGEVEVLTFTARRVWTVMTCDGPPCCPMRWFIDTGGGDFVSIDSWEWLGFAPDHHFPGGEVTVERLPESNWLITAAASGDPVPMLPQEDRDAVEFQTVHHASDVL